MNSVKIKFGTDGWRAIIADDYTVENVKRVAEATAEWLKNQKKDASVVVGNDCRFAGKLFADTTARVMASFGIKVYLAENKFVSTPMISLGTVNKVADLGIIITASHNPAEYNGFKIKANYGGPATPSVISEIEDAIADISSSSPESLEDYLKNGIIEYIDLETMYVDHVEKNFNMDAIINSGLNFAYDAMYGAGQNVMRRIMPDLTFLHCDYNPGFDGQAPEPIHKNLTELSELIKVAGNIDAALVTDGDADRIGMYDENGNFVDSHHLLLLLIHYMHKYKKMEGKVITTFSCTQKLADLCKAYQLDHTITKIGFKYICELMVQDEEGFMVGGEESGGIAVAGHIPERDGIWIGLLIWEFMAVTGKSLTELVSEVYEAVGSFSVERNDMRLKEEVKQAIINKCKNNEYKSFGDLMVTKVEDMDGYKFHFTDGEWVMIRPSGTEPVLRTYAEAANSERAFEILNHTEKTLLG